MTPNSTTTRAAATALCVAAALLGCAASPTTMPPAMGAAAPAAWNAAALQEVLDYAREQKTTGLLIIQNRQVIAEQHWPLPADATAFRAAFVHGQAADGALLEDVASQQKSFIALLAAIAADRGLLDVERPVAAYIGAGWSKAPPAVEARTTVRHLLEMTSGLTEDLRSEAEPGARFFYNTPAYAVTKRVLEQAARQPLDEITRQWLTVPLGMGDTAWRPRPAALADAGNSTGLVTTPRDIARMGQLVLDQGLASDGRRVVSAAQLGLLLQRTPTNPAYGRLWWLNGGSHAYLSGPGAPRREGVLIEAAPADLVAALGFHDRKLFVVPSRQLIVVRTGQTAPARDFNQQLWQRLMKAVPAGG